MGDKPESTGRSKRQKLKPKSTSDQIRVQLGHFNSQTTFYFYMPDFRDKSVEDEPATPTLH